eukprot:s2898_g12.t1
MPIERSTAGDGEGPEQAPCRFCVSQAWTPTRSGPATCRRYLHRGSRLARAATQGKGKGKAKGKGKGKGMSWPRRDSKQKKKEKGKKKDRKDKKVKKKDKKEKKKEKKEEKKQETVNKDEDRTD